MSDRDFRNWLKTRLLRVDESVKAPQSLKDKIRDGIKNSKG